ncbi:hypothetical protein ILYODFUR_024664, partial [Ilyodon furcidens]
MEFSFLVRFIANHGFICSNKGNVLVCPGGAPDLLLHSHSSVGWCSALGTVAEEKNVWVSVRSNCFEVFALDGARTSILQFCTAAESTDWLQAISTNINSLTQENIKILNKSSSSDNQ